MLFTLETSLKKYLRIYCVCFNFKKLSWISDIWGYVTYFTLETSLKKYLRIYLLLCSFYKKLSWTSDIWGYVTYSRNVS